MKIIKLSVCLLLTLLIPRFASALIVGPYTSDANTTFLFHFDEAAGSSVTTNVGTVGGNAYPVMVGLGVGTSILATNITTLLGGSGYSAGFTNTLSMPGTNSGFMVGFAGASSSFTTDTGNGGTRSPNAIAESVLGIGAGANSPWTIEAMIKPNVTNFNQEIVCLDSYASSRGFQFKLTTAGLLQFQTIGGTAYSQTAAIPATGANAFVPGNWYHVAVVYNGSAMQLYWTAVNPGTIVAAPLGSAGTPTSGSMGTVQGAITGPLIIGNKDRLAATECFNGAIDEVRISKVARSATQMLFASATVVITQPPIGQEGVDYGGTGILTVGATSLATMGYQWWQNTTPITGATNATYSFTNAVAANAGSYTCVITNVNGSATTSSVASVVIGAANFLTNRYSFTVDASDSIGGQNGTVVGGATFNGNGTLTLDGSSGFVQLPVNMINTNMGAITLETWAGFGTIANNSQLFAFGNTNGTSGYNYIFATPHGTVARMAITAGNYTTEQIAAAGTALDNYNNVQIVAVFAPYANTETFYTNGVLAAINTNATLPLASVIDNFSYLGHSLYSGDPYLACTLDEFRVYDGALSAASVLQSYLQGSTNILSDGPVQFVSSPVNASAAQGLPVTFSSLTSGHPPIVYQWLKNSVVIPGATNASYTYSPSFADNNASFQVLATNNIGGTNYSASSGSATLTVSVPTTLAWLGASDQYWNLSSLNWSNAAQQLVAYAQFDGAVFDDRGAGQPTVDLQQAFTPVSMVVSNNAANYTLTSSAQDGSFAVLGTLVKQGTGTLQLDVTNNSAGPTIVQNGILQVGAGDTLGSLGTGPVTNSGTLSFNRSDSIAVPNDLHGGGTVSYDGSGSVTPTSTNNDYTGSTLVNNGILYLVSSSGLGASTGTTVASGAQLYITANVNVGPEALTLAGVGDGNGALRKGGAGVTTYGGALTLAGDTTISVDAGATLMLTNAAGIAGAGDALTAAGTGTLTLGGPVNLGADTLTVSGGGTLNLNSTNTYSGGTTVAAGIINANTNGVFGTGGIECNSGSSVGRIVLGTGTTLTNSIQADSVAPGAATGLLMVNDNTNGTTTTISGPIVFNATAVNGGHLVGPTSSGCLNVSGPITMPAATPMIIRFGFLRFSGGGNYQEIQVRANTTSIGANNGIATNAVMDIGGNGSPTVPTYFDLSGFNQDLGGLKNTVTPVNFGVVTNSGATVNVLSLDLGVGNVFSFSGDVVGNVALMLNSGQQIFTGTNTYTGNTTINGGTLELATPSIAGNSTVTVASGATLQLDFTVTNTVGALVLAGVSQTPGVYNNTASPTFITGSGSLLVASPVNTNPVPITATVNGGNLVLSWPTDHIGWRLLVETNSLATGLSTNWVNVPNANTVSSVTNALNTGNGTVFYRMVYP